MACWIRQKLEMLGLRCKQFPLHRIGGAVPDHFALGEVRAQLSRCAFMFAHARASGINL